VSSLALWIAAFLLAEFALQRAAEVVNLRRSDEPPPRLVADLYDGERLSRFRRSFRDRTRLEWAAAGTQMTVLMAFWFGGGFAVADRWARAATAVPLLQGLLFLGGLALARWLLALPFAVWHTFVVEERYGFNRTTPAVFAADRAKELGLALALGLPLAAGVLWFFHSRGGSAWLWCWLAVAAFLLGVPYVAPHWILPLFHRFTPLEEGPLRREIDRYARSIGFPLGDIVVMDGSRRSTRSNAFFTGFGRNRRIVLYDTLVERHGVDELVAVLAHEMGHYKQRHIPVMAALGILQTGVFFYLLSLLIASPVLAGAFYLPEPSVHGGIVFFAILFSPLETVAGVGVQALSRRNELAADRFSVETAGRPQALADALRKLSAENLSHPRPHSLAVWLNHSHPPLARRLQGIEGAAGRPLRAGSPKAS
jgi:STE24 endopeptidase